MRPTRFFAFALGAAVAVAGPAVFAGYHYGAVRMDVSQQDQDFINKAWNINETEIRLGNIAKENAGNDDVKSFGKDMMKDHKDLNDDLEKLAKDNNATCPGELEKQNQDAIDKLSALHGDDFDKQYMTAMVSGHRGALEAFKAQGSSGDSPVDKWAADTAPKIQHHLDMAIKTGKEVGADVGDEGGH
jgi:putative membrane protein